MPTANLNGIDLYFEEEGSGSPLVLIGGYTCDLSQWAPVRAALAARYRLLLVDNRWAGRSDCPDTPGTIAMMAADVAALMQERRLTRAHVVAHSLGAAMAQTLAREYSVLVGRLVLSNSFTKVTPGTSLALRWLLKLRQQGVADRLLVEGMMPWLFSPALLANAQVAQAVADMILANRHPQSLVGQTRQLEALLAFDSSAWSGEISVPTLVLAGLEDISAPKAGAEALALSIRGAQLQLLDGMAHLPMLEAPEDFARRVIEFCG